ncbi:uncharacterized protein PV07_10512 [Cladophialophora immunda]|uniref:Uncharacterized protein n=1 Tax=Cladophialophora immunda TaxID=569365 RepID=A0A0D2AIT6_9EURO|nr:uncharacterized protein PV07_10512 [Cladophialophora immunda]KIW24822.1 hypothetical protein PV07_10512 [Cladophialophora immunda]
MDFIYQHFLEPPHQHNLDDLGEVIIKPSLCENTLHTELRHSYQAVYVSTSIALASLKRQRTLYQEWATLQVGPGPNHAIIAKYAKFNASRRVKAEIFYFDNEAMPDWRRKAFFLQSQLDHPCLTQAWLDTETLDAWLKVVRDIVNKWCEESQQLKDRLVVPIEESALGKTMVADESRKQ